jgi:hypothetical protein
MAADGLASGHAPLWRSRSWFDQQNRRPVFEATIPSATIDIRERDSITLQHATRRQILDIYRLICEPKLDPLQTESSNDSTTTVQSARNAKRKKRRQALAAAKTMAAESGAEATSTEDEPAERGASRRQP